jgi:hypothetical protein
MFEDSPPLEDFESAVEEYDQVRGQAVIDMFEENPPLEDFEAFVDEYNQVFDKLKEIFEDYAFFYSTRGVQYDIDVYRDPDELDQRAQEALEDVTDP